MSKFLIAANWKLNDIPDGALEAGSPFQPRDNVDVVVFATFTDLKECIAAGLNTGAQHSGRIDVDYGAFTGDMSLAKLVNTGCKYVLCGHSDRRRDHGETNEDVAAQARAVLEAGLHPICCVGETLEQRSAGQAEHIVQEQVAPLPTDQLITIAYEPVWAISQGNPDTPAATPDDAESMHGFIRGLFDNAAVRLLYGGSMKPENAQELLSLPHVDGGLVGGASLKGDSFGSIVDTASSLS